MIPFYHYGPDGIPPDSTSNAYYLEQPQQLPLATEISSRDSLGVINLDPPDHHTLFDPSIYSHPQSAPPTPYQPQINLDANSGYPPSYYDQLYHNSTSLLHFDQLPVASSSTIPSAQARTTPESAPPPLSNPLPFPPPTRRTRSLDETLGAKAEVEGKTRGSKRGKRRMFSTSIREARQSGASQARRPLPDQAAEVETVKAAQSCKACRSRKVRCSRDWPKCERCDEKSLECSYGSLVPASLVQTDERLEEKIRTLEEELRLSRIPSPSEFPSFLAEICTSGVDNRDDPSERDLDMDGRASIQSGLRDFVEKHGYHPEIRSFLELRLRHLERSTSSLSPGDQVALALSLSVSSFVKEKQSSEIGNPLRSCALSIYSEFEIAYEESAEGGLALHVFGSRIFTWSDPNPRRARGWLATALSIFKDLVDASGPGEEARLKSTFGLSLLNLDSSIALRNSTSPLVSYEDLKLYFPILPSTEPTSSISTDLSPFLSAGTLESPLDPNSSLNMEEILNVIRRWVVKTLRMAAENLSPRKSRTTVSSSSHNLIFAQVAQLHSTIACIRNRLVRQMSTSRDTTSPHLEQQLIALSCLDRQVDEAVFMSYTRVEAQGHSMREGVTEGLRRAAFHSRTYFLSSMPFELQNVFRSLACLPSWTQLAVEHAPSAVPNQLGVDLRQAQTSLCETELDWLESGLETISAQEKGWQDSLKVLRSLRALRGGVSSGVEISRSKSINGLSFRQALLQASKELVGKNQTKLYGSLLSS